MFIYTAWLTINYYFGRARFEVTWWAFSFPVDSMAFIWIAYHVAVPGNVTQIFVYIFMALACGMNVYLGVITVVEGARRQLFVPEVKAGMTPPSFDMYL